MANAEQVEYWEGHGGEHWAAEAERYDSINRRFAERIVEALDPRPGERVLDVGCGNGALALAIGPRVAPDGDVTGLDLSGPMLAVARRRAEEAGLDNVAFEKGDAQVHPLPEAGFDAVVSRFGVMFFDDPTAAFANLRRALRPGGRLVVACWHELLRNEWLTVPSAAMLAYVPMPDLGDPGGPGPFSLADPGRIRSILDDAGFVDSTVDEVAEPMCMGSSAEDAVAFMSRTEMAARLLQDANEETAQKAWDAVGEAFARYESPDGVVLTGTAWLVAARRS